MPALSAVNTPCYFLGGNLSEACQRPDFHQGSCSVYTLQYPFCMFCYSFIMSKLFLPAPVKKFYHRNYLAGKNSLPPLGFFFFSMYAASESVWMVKIEAWLWFLDFFIVVIIPKDSRSLRSLKYVGRERLVALIVCSVGSPNIPGHRSLLFNSTMYM